MMSGARGIGSVAGRDLCRHGRDVVRPAVVGRIVAISYGRNLIEGDPNEVMCSDEVQACYMGGTPI